MKTVLDIGNCDADHGFIKGMLESNFQAQLIRAHRLEDTMKSLEDNEVDLIMINRLLDADGSEGMEVFRKLKASDYASVPAMLITNFKEHQEAATAEGAVPGFGKSSLYSPETIETVGNALGIST
jgi:two-component SAPR family response regulator